MKALTVVDDCTKEVVQIVADTSIPALYVTRVLDHVSAERGLPRIIRTDNGPEFAGRVMQTWAAHNRVELRFIQPGKPVQNAYIESFNSRFRDECLSQHWFASLSHAQRHRQLARRLQPPPAAQHARLRAASHVRGELPASSLAPPRNHHINYDAKPWALDRSATKLGGSAASL